MYWFLPHVRPSVEASVFLFNLGRRRRRKKDENEEEEEEEEETTVSKWKQFQMNSRLHIPSHYYSQPVTSSFSFSLFSVALVVDY